jgi:uncharacterized repeat protein (TIGR01451 family)
MKANRVLMCLVAGLTMFAADGTASAQMMYFDDFNQFANGMVLTETNYSPGFWMPPGTTAAIFTNTPGYGSIIASNLLGSIRLFFNAPPNPVDPKGNAGYGANLYLWCTDLNPVVTNQVVDVQWLSWIAGTGSASHTGGLAIAVATTNMESSCDSGFFSNMHANVLVFYGDNGSVYAFTNDSNNGGGSLPIVQIGSWGTHANTIMTNHLVLNYPARTFSLSLNGILITNNMTISQYFTNEFNGLDFGAVEMLPSSAGNQFALDDVQIVVTNAGRDVRDFLVAAKGQGFEQTSSNAPSPVATSWFFHSEVQAVTTDSVWLAKVHFPGGGKTNLVWDSFDPSFWGFDAPFTSQTALNAAYTNGLYRLNILGRSQGAYQSSLNLSGDSYPNTPQIQNFDAAQAINASTNFTLQWNSSGGGTGDWVMLEVDDALGNIVLSTPDFAESNALRGTVTSLVITDGTLQASSTYSGQLVFARPVAVDTNSIPGAVGAAVYFKQTEFTLATLPPPGPSCVLTPALATNDIGTVHTVTATVTTNSVAVAGVTVYFLVTGANSVTTNGVTDAGGQVPLSYTGGALGTDTIQATGAVSSLAFTGTAVKVWLATNVPPVAVCTNVTVLAGTNCQASVSAAEVDNGSYDPDGGSIVSSVLTPPGPYSLGTNDVTLTVTDNRGGTNSCSAKIYVIDNTPPVVTCASDIVTNAPFGQTNAVVDFSAPTVSDNCSVISTNYCAPASGTTFPLGTNTVTCTAVDGSENTNTCSFEIVVAATPAQADLALTAASSVTTASLNNACTYTLVVTNKGPQNAPGAQLVDTLPSSVMYSNATSSVGSCTNIGGVVTCDFGTLTNGVTATVSVVVTPTNPAVASVCSAVTVTNSLLDPVTVNNYTNICTPVVINNLAVTAFKAPKKVALSATKTNVVGKLSVTIQNRSLHAETIPNLTVLSNLVTITLSPLGTNSCTSPVVQLVPPKKALPIALASGKSLKLAYTVNFTCATDPLATTKTANHSDYQYLVTVNHTALNGQTDSYAADDTCPHNALGVIPYGNGKIKDKGCGLKIKGTTGTFTNVVTDITDSRTP